MTSTITYSVNMVMRPIDLVANPVFRRRVKAILGNGERSAGELLAELIARDPGFGLKRLKTFAALSPKHPNVTGGEEFSPLPPLRAVPTMEGDRSPAEQRDSWTRLGDAIKPVIDRLTTTQEGPGHG